MSRSTVLFRGSTSSASSSEITALKKQLEETQAKITLLETGGVGINQDTLTTSLKPLQDQLSVVDQSAKDALSGVGSVDDKVDVLAGVVDTNSTNANTKIAALQASDKSQNEFMASYDSKLANQEYVMSLIEEKADKAISDLANEAVIRDTVDEDYGHRIIALEGRKEVKENKIITTLLDGSTRPFGAQASGFNQDGTGPLAGATSFNAWQAVSASISQSGLADDVYEIAVGFSRAALFGNITLNINGERRIYSQQGIQAGTLPLVEFNDGDWRGVTLKVTGSFSGDVIFVGWNGSVYIGPVVKRTRIDGVACDGKRLAYSSDTPKIDLTPYALKTDIPVSPDLSGFALKTDVNALSTTVGTNKTSADATQTALDTYKNSNNTALAAVKTTADAAAKQTDLTSLTTTVTNNKASADAGIASAIADWDANRTYAKDQICIRNKAFFISNVANNKGNNPATATNSSWAPFVPGEVNSVYFNRSPTNQDVMPENVKWYDISYSADTPVSYRSLGNGGWLCLSQLTLAKIRIYGNGTVSTYRSNISNIKFFKPTGEQIPTSWFVCGSSSGLWGAGAGVPYTGQKIEGQYNASGFYDLEVSSLFDSSIAIGRVTGTYPTGGNFFNCSKIEFYYTNGSRKAFTGAGNLQGDQTLCICDPAVTCRIGDAIVAVLGEKLSSIKTTDPNNFDYGLVNGSVLASLVNPLLTRIAALESKVGI